MRLSAPRILPVSEGDYRSLYYSLFGEEFPEPGPLLNMTRTWARHPALMKAQRPYQLFIRDENLISKQEQLLAILRIGWLCECEYVFAQHAVLGLRADLTDDDLLRITKGPDADGWTPHRSAILRAVDELYQDHIISHQTWAVLSRTYDDAQMIDLIVAVGRYWSNAVLLNSLGVRLEDGIRGFPVEHVE